MDDVRRLQASLTALQEAHAQQLQRLEERLDEKKQHIARLEARLDTQRDYDDVKREIRWVSVFLFKHMGRLLVEYKFYKFLKRFRDTRDRNPDNKKRKIKQGLNNGWKKDTNHKT